MPIYDVLHGTGGIDFPDGGGGIDECWEGETFLNCEVQD
jgi:hypothetical protein